MIEQLSQDIRYAARQLMRAPLFTTVSALSLGLAIAVAVTAYSIINGMVFKPLPVRDRDGLMHVEAVSDVRNRGAAYGDVKELMASGVFSGLAAQVSFPTTVEVRGHAASRTEVTYVSPDFFRVLGLDLVAGRAFSGGGEAPEIIISERFRDRTFEKGDPVIGSKLAIQGTEFTIIGVAPKSYHGLRMYSNTIGWVPAPTMRLTSGGRASAVDSENRYWGLIGRLSPGLTPESAMQRLIPLSKSLAERYPRWREGRTALEIRVRTHRDEVAEMVDKYLREALIALAALVTIVLSLACTNVAGLLLARTVARRHEVAVRITLGAPRSRIAMQFMTEALMLALLGGTVGWVGAQWAMALMSRSPMLESFDLSQDWRVFASTLVTCVLCALAFGVTPLGQTLRANVSGGLSGHAVGERGEVRGRLIALQVCLSCILVVLGMSASRGVQAKMRTTDGFSLDGLVVADVTYPARRTAADSLAARNYIRAVETMFAASPSVIRTTRSMTLPLTYMDGVDVVAGWKNATGFAVRHQRVDSDYFPTLGVPLLSGQLPPAIDTSGVRRMAIVNHTVSTRAGRNVVGTTMTLGETELLVVGEVDDLQRVSAGMRQPRVYELAPRDLSQPFRSWYVVARVRPGTEAAVIAEISRGIRSRYPEMTVPNINSLRSRIEASVAPQRIIARCAFAFGVVELLLAAVGLYSLLLYAMLTRTREIGVRMALGARPRNASFTIIKSGLQFVIAGLVLGAIAAIPAGIIAGRNFTGADARDPIPYAAALVGIVVATIAASYIPARRAARVEPMVALRHE